VVPGYFVFGLVKKSTVIQNGISTTEETINLSIPVSGPKGAGTIEVAAAKSGDKWIYPKVSVILPNRKTPISRDASTMAWPACGRRSHDQVTQSRHGVVVLVDRFLGAVCFVVVIAVKLCFLGQIRTAAVADA